MAGLLRSFLHATSYRSPLLRTVVPTTAAAFAIQGLVAIPSILGQTERFYDLSGSLTYLSCAALSLYLPVLRARAATGAGTFSLPWPSILKSLQGKSLAQGGFWDWRQLVLTAFVGIWATRCLSKQQNFKGQTNQLIRHSGIIPLFPNHQRKWSRLSLRQDPYLSLQIRRRLLRSSYLGLARHASSNGTQLHTSHGFRRHPTFDPWDTCRSRTVVIWLRLRGGSRQAEESMDGREEGKET